jgi:cytochrome c oxidase assembly protein subunit 20
MDVPTWSDAFSSISTSSFGSALSVPCIRQALIVGMTCGFVAGGGMWISGRPGFRIANTAVLTFLGSSPVSFAYCDWDRRRERRTVRVVKEAWETKRTEKKLEWEKFREEKMREAQMDAKQKTTPKEKTTSSSWWWSQSKSISRGREG